jgi:hypothetical protein
VKRASERAVVSSAREQVSLCTNKLSERCACLLLIRLSLRMCEFVTPLGFDWLTLFNRRQN